MVRNISSLHPQCGEKNITGRLRSQGILVQRKRIRESIRRVDPIGVELRARRVLHRRMYCVECPNALWYLDGYHKLIRWKIVIHGGIDGHSRLITYLRSSSNNRASIPSCQLLPQLLMNLAFHLALEQTEEERMSLFLNICFSTPNVDLIEVV